MSVNHHFSLGAAAAAWWSPHSATEPPEKSPSSHDSPSSFLPTACAAAPAGGIFSFNLNNEDEEELADGQAEVDGGGVAESVREREVLFEKTLTPSDVGKLNRLVIPKQHAERNFPMNGGSESGENGLLLNFEDELGKLWRFRYSYWNSSQSYVLTKGWSRFVKDKHLDAGDVVTFSRHGASVGRLFIGSRRGLGRGNPVPVGGGWNRGIPPYPLKNPERSGQETGSSVPQNQALAAANGNSKRLRLFGVNLEFNADEQHSTAPANSLVYDHLHPHHQLFQNHMDMMSFSGGGSMYRQGYDDMGDVTLHHKSQGS